MQNIIYTVKQSKGFLKLNSKSVVEPIDLSTDIIEGDIVRNLPGVLSILLKDRTTNRNIFWATDDYEHLGEEYKYNKPITTKLITGKNTKVIMPRALKTKDVQKKRTRTMAEVFTPMWICNRQINLIDEAWFGRKNIFNREKKLKNGNITWVVNKGKISFPRGKTWVDYVKDTRLEITCGEGPYLTSRYDTVTGEFVQDIYMRIGILDRKLRVVNENTKTEQEWFKYAKLAYQNTYGYEWQGDNLLLAREAMLATFIENYIFKFDKWPKLDWIKEIAYIISWNLWQMDGLKMVVPNTCTKVCDGCKKNDYFKHDGKYAKIMDWESGHVIQFTELLVNNNQNTQKLPFNNTKT